MASYNNLNQNQNVYQNPNQKSFFSKVLRDLSNWGMNYDDMIQRNKVSVAINEDPSMSNSTNDMYGFFSQRAITSLLEKKSIKSLDKSYQEKRRILREYSVKNEISDYIEIVCNEAIIYQDDKFFANVLPLPQSHSKTIQDAYMKAYEKVYYAFGFSDGKYAWDLFKDFVIDGALAMEIIYDDKDLNIIGFSRIDPYTLTPAVDDTTGKDVWIQFYDDPQYRKIILDSKIIYISYKAHTDYGETSYVEGLIRPYNQYEILIKTRLMYNIVNASINQVFKIPITGLSRQRAEEEISKLIANYSEYIQFDDTTGEIIINGSKNLQLNKQIWLPSGESGTPEVDFMKPEGHNLNESEVLNWFYTQLKRASKIPASRLESEAGGGNVYTDLNEMTRDEIRFGQFIKRLRASFKEILTKPLRLQMMIEFPELMNNVEFINDIRVEFISNDLFEEWRKMNNFKKRLEAANSALELKLNETESYFDLDYIVEDILKLTPDQIKKNKAYKIKNKGKNINPEGGDTGGESGGFGGGGGSFGGDDFGGGGSEPSDFGNETGGESGGESGGFGGGDETGAAETGGADDFEI